MVPDSRTLCPEIAQQTYHHGICSYTRSRRASGDYLRLRSWKATLVELIQSFGLPLVFECPYLASSAHPMYSDDSTNTLHKALL